MRSRIQILTKGEMFRVLLRQAPATSTQPWVSSRRRGDDWQPFLWKFDYTGPSVFLRILRSSSNLCLFKFNKILLFECFWSKRLVLTVFRLEYTTLQLYSWYRDILILVVLLQCLIFTNHSECSSLCSVFYIRGWSLGL